jgi:hypothetical protein
MADMLSHRYYDSTGVPPSCLEKEKVHFSTTKRKYQNFHNGSDFSRRRLAVVLIGLSGMQSRGVQLEFG